MEGLNFSLNFCRVWEGSNFSLNFCQVYQTGGTFGHVYERVHQQEAIVDTFETPSPSEKAANRPPINYVVPKISNM